MSKRPDSLKSLAKAMPLICRVATETTRTLRAATGEPITDELRDQLLAKCAAGEHVEIDVDILAFEQRPGVANRNFLRFRDGAMLKLGASGKGTPFLKNHDQGDVEARGGTITRSQTEKVGEGEYHLRQTARLSAPWAVSMALRGLLDKVSIGWAGDDVTCSVCGTAVYTECYHWPGDRVSEEAGADGKKRYVRDRKGSLRVEWIFNDPSLVETSAVNVPAVPMAGIEAVRAALSAVMPDHAEGDGLFVDAPPHADPEVAALSARPQPSPSAKPKEREMSGKNAPATESTENAPTEAEFQTRLAEAVKKQRADERTLAAVCAKHKLNVDVPALLEKHGSLQAARDAVLDMLSERQDSQDPIRGEHTGGVTHDERDKRLELYQGALLARMSGKAAKTNEQNRLANLSAMEIAEEIAMESGLSIQEIRRYSGEDRARLLMGKIQPSRQLAGGGRITTSDLPGLVGAAGTELVQRQFAERPQAWKKLGRQENLPNFERQYKYGAGRFPALKAVPQGGVYQRGSFVESSEYKRLGKAGRMLSLTWELLLADKLGEFARVIADYGRAARRYETRQFFRKLIGTAGAGIMYDGTDLFSVANKNISGTTGTPSVPVLDAGMQKMALQRDRPGDPNAIDEDDREGDELELEAKYWLNPVVYATAASQILSVGHAPDDATDKATDEMRAILVVRAPRLDREATKRHYLFADPMDVAAFEYGYLTTEPGPALIREEGFTVDGVDYKCRFTNYLEFVEHRAVVRIDPA